MNKSNTTNKKSNSKVNKVLLYIIIPLVAYFVFLFIVNVIMSFISNKTFTIDWSLFLNSQLYIYSAIPAGILFIIAIGISLWYDMFAASKILNKAEDAKNGIYGDSRWLTQDELKSKFGLYNFANLPETEISGYVVQSFLKNGTLQLSMIEKQHALMCGVSGDGKSLRYIGMCIQANANSKTQASMIINDAKGELFDKHSKFLEERGYDVKLINLRYPHESLRFNPLTLIWDLWQNSIDAENSVYLSESQLNAEYSIYTQRSTHERSKAPVKKRAKAAKSHTVVMSKEEFYQDWQRKQLKKAADCKERAEVLIQEISKIIVPDGTGENKQWSDGAQGICAGIILAMLEDGFNDELAFNRDMFTISQISNIVNRQQNKLEAFLKLRPSESPVFDFAGMIIDNESEKTVSSYLSTLSSNLKNYLEGGMKHILSGTDFDLKTMVTRPTAMFILVPDEYPTRHVLASMAITQIYNELIFQSSEYENNCLPRPVYFMLDEFGNLPQMTGVPIWITISKSRNIYFNVIVQSISQLYSKYGEYDAKTIMQNCHLQMILGSNEGDTLKHYQDLFGVRTIINRTANFDQKTATIEFQGSSTLGKVELITTDQLKKIPPGLVYWKLLREQPAQTHLEIIYNMQDIIQLGCIDKTSLLHQTSTTPIYDLTERNEYIKAKLHISPDLSESEYHSNDSLYDEEMYNEIMMDEDDDIELQKLSEESIHEKLYKI